MRLVQVLAGLLLIVEATGTVSTPNLIAQVPSGTNGSASLELNGTLPNNVFPGEGHKS